MKKFVAWRRETPKGQRKKGWDSLTQKNVIEYFVNYENGELIADFEDSYIGKDLDGCIELKNAISCCKKNNAILIIAKTDKFNSVKDALHLYDEMHGDIYFCDLPHTDKSTLTLFFALAERDTLLVSIRTKQALDVIKEKCVKGEIHTSKSGKAITKLGRPKGCPKNVNANKASAESKRATAMANPNNQRFIKFVTLYERNNGRLEKRRDYIVLSEQLNALDYKTSTGMEFTDKRARAMYSNLKKYSGKNLHHCQKKQLRWKLLVKKLLNQRPELLNLII